MAFGGGGPVGAGGYGGSFGGKSTSSKGSNVGGGKGLGGAKHGGVSGYGSGSRMSKGAQIGKSLGNATNGIGSANAAIGTFGNVADPVAHAALQGAPMDPGFFSRVADAVISAAPFISRTTSVNPYSGFTESNYTGGLLDGLGSIMGGMFGAPGLGMAGGWADSKLGTSVDLGTDTYGEGWGGQSFGGGYSGGGYSGAGMGGMGGNRGGGYVARGGQGSPAPAMNLPPSATPVPPTAAMPASDWNLPGFAMDTRFGRGTVSPYGMFG